MAASRPGREQRQLDPPDGLGQLVLGRDRDAPRLRQRAVRLDDPERHEQPGDRRAVVEAAEGLCDAGERVGTMDRLDADRRAVDEPGDR